MPPAPRSRWTAVLVLFVSLAATAVVGYGLDGATQQRDLIRFRGLVQTTCDRIQGRIANYEALLLGARSLLLAQPGLSAEQFRTYVAALSVQSRFAGIQGIGFSRRVAAADLPAFQAERQHAEPSYRVWPPGERAEYFPIALLEPLDRRNRAALGYDMFSEPVRRRAMERAWHSGEPAASGKVLLVQEIDAHKQPGFLIYVPVYTGQPQGAQAQRDALIGFVYSPFRARDLMRGIFGGEQRPMLAFRVYDGETASAEALLVEQGQQRSERAGTLVASAAVVVAGTTWRLRFQATPEFELGSSRRLVPLFVIAGILMSGLFFLVIVAQVRAREQAEAAESERTRLLELEQRARAEAVAQGSNLRALFTQAPAAIAIVRGPEFRYELSNPMNEHLAGNRGMLGKTVREVLPELEAQGLLRLLEHVLHTGEPFVGSEIPLRMRGADGRERELYINGTYQPLRTGDGSIDGVMAFAYEVTEQVLARKKVEQSERELQQAVRTRDDFLAVAGHEFKTPLATLQLQLEGVLRQVERGAFGQLPAPLIARLDKTQGQLQRLGALVEELLDVSRITSGRLALHLEPVELSALLREICERFAEQLARAECELSLDLPARIVGHWDRTRLDQVISNLLDNAIKYGPGKPIEIGVEQLSERARIRVRDHGIGIDPQHRERIFGRFERAVSGQHYGGLGLGLWISRQILEQLGGTIRCDGTAPAGTTFLIELPLAPATPAPATPGIVRA